MTKGRRRASGTGAARRRRAMPKIADTEHIEELIAEDTPIVMLRVRDLRRLLAELSPPAEPESLIDRETCAARLSISPKQLDRLCKKGLPFHRVGDLRRFEWTEVLRWTRAQATAEPGLRLVGDKS